MERISEDDRIRHERMILKVREAQDLEERIRELSQLWEEVRSEWRDWCYDLHRRYDLKTDGSEAIDEEGNILRFWLIEQEEAKARQEAARRVELDPPPPPDTKPFVLPIVHEHHHTSQKKFAPLLWHLISRS